MNSLLKALAIAEILDGGRRKQGFDTMRNVMNLGMLGHNKDDFRKEILRRVVNASVTDPKTKNLLRHLISQKGPIKGNRKGGKKKNR